MVKIAYKIFSDERLIVITDAVESQEEKELPRLPDGTIAGGISTMIENVRNLAGWGIPLESAVKMASHNPARAIGFGDKKGRVEAGFDADLLVVDDELSINKVLIGGKIIC